MTANMKAGNSTKNEQNKKKKRNDYRKYTTKQDTDDYITV